jgi:NADH-quinone oxidoreductase subunit M
VWPVHTWLPEAYREAPIGAAALLGGVLLKVGGYIFLRFSIPMLPAATDILAPLVYALAVFALIYISFVVFMITQAHGSLRKWVAYATLAHMGFGYIGMFTLTTQGLQGAVIVLVSYGLIAVALFCAVGMLEERAKTSEIAKISGVVRTMPIFAFSTMVFILASVGMPGTSGFVGEFLVLVGAFLASTWLAVFAATIIVLGCIYALWMYRLVIFEKAERADCSGFKDLNLREVAIVVPLMLVILWIGIYPDSFIHETTTTVANLINHYQTALADAGSITVTLH